MTSVEPTASFQVLQGSVHGGQQPVAGATITLMAPGTSGYGTAGTVLATATTTAYGNFNMTLPTPANCPANSGLIYITATGGNPGAGTNTALAEAAILGPCSGLSTLAFLSINEVTTVAAAYTLAPFASISAGVTNIGTSSTNLTGLYNAAAAAGNLVNLTTGHAGTSATGITLPTAEMNTLADILSACVNTGVAGVASTTCSSLFTAATPPNGTAPIDTFQAAIDIALNPGNNAATLYGLSTPSPPYQPTLSAAPTDFALGIVYTGGAIAKSTGPQGIDIDAQGNAWVSILGLRTIPNGVVEISPAGVVSPTSGTYLNTMSTPEFVAINSGGMVEVTDFNNGVYQYSPAGSTGTGFTSSPVASGLNGPGGLAIDNRDSSVWVANYGNNTIAHISNTGVLLTATPLPAGSFPFGIVLDPAGDVIATDSDFNGPGTNASITEYVQSPPGTYTQSTYGSGLGTTIGKVALDNSGNVWAVLGTGGILEIAQTGALISPAAGYTSTANLGDTVEIDGLGRAFVSNTLNNSNSDLPGTLTIFSSNGTLISTSNSGKGYSANMTIPGDLSDMALDSSGNCWITGNTPNGVTEIIGIAAPVPTPLAVQSYPTNRIGTRP